MSLVRLFLDANVLFSAAYGPAGRAAGLLKLAESGRCVLFTSPHAAAEARRNIRLKRPEAEKHLEDALAWVSLVGEARAEDVNVGLEQGLPLKDTPIFGVAVRSDADYLVTGDVRHFGHLFDRVVGGVRVVTPATALAVLLEE
ncbi:MAG: PIN domain-containing protein [Rubrobacteraceae bacterium]